MPMHSPSLHWVRVPFVFSVTEKPPEIDSQKASLTGEFDPVGALKSTSQLRFRDGERNSPPVEVSGRRVGPVTVPGAGDPTLVVLVLALVGVVLSRDVELVDPVIAEWLGLVVEQAAKPRTETIKTRRTGRDVIG